MKNKVKTKNIVARRVKITSTGKILHRSNFKGHLRRNKSASQKRRYRKLSEFSPARNNKVKKILGLI